jgi:uncharacterized membrane protein YtjA (UPF0391 family)
VRLFKPHHPGGTLEPTRLYSVTASEPPVGEKHEVFEMLGWIITFLVIALIAGVLGFGGIAGAATSIAQILFFIFLIALVVSLVMHLMRRA